MLFFLGIVALTVGSVAYQRHIAKKAAGEQREAQEALWEEQAKSAARARAVQQAPLSAEQMRKVTQQRKLESIVELFVEQEQSPTIHTLPTAKKSSPVDRINDAIHQLITGAA